MPRSIPRTAAPGRSQSPHDSRARGLGLFSIALGVTELLAPRAVCAAVGLDGHEGLVRAYGAREIATGAAILASHDATPWIWGRVLGDAADLATVAMGLGEGKPKKDNAVLALTALAAVTAVDIICAKNLSAEKGGRRTALADYSDRTGYSGGVPNARGAARDFRVPSDMRIPDPLRPDGFQRRNG